MWTQFYFELGHFALNVLAALVFFAVAWLYLDAWFVRHFNKEGLRVLGFLLLAVSYLVHAVHIETSIVAQPLMSTQIYIILFSVARIGALLLIIASLVLDPLQPKPEYRRRHAAGFLLPSLGIPGWVLRLPPSLILSPQLALTAAMLYIRRATVGLERHILPVGIAFFGLSVSEFLSLAEYLRITDNPDLYRLVAPFGPVWILEHIVLFGAILLLRDWVFRYLLKRFETQLFFIAASGIVILFLLTSGIFTGLLLRTIEEDTLKQLSSDVRVLDIALESRKAEVIAGTEVVSQDPGVLNAVKTGDRQALARRAEAFLLSKKYSSLVITDAAGSVLARGEDAERSGESLSDSVIVSRALEGSPSASIVKQQGVVAPQIVITAAVPIIEEGSILGVVTTGVAIDTAFVDGMKQRTGLDAGLYGGSVLTASTLAGSDGLSRLVGIPTRKEIQSTVLEHGLPYQGVISLNHTLYLSAYLPLRTLDGQVVGMLSVSRPETDVLSSAGRAVEVTFMVTVALLVGSFVPAWLIARGIARQL